MQEPVRVSVNSAALLWAFAQWVEALDECEPRVSARESGCF